MINEEGDFRKNSGALVFAILISLFVLSFGNQSEPGIQGSDHYSLNPDLATGCYSSHSESVFFDSPLLPVVVKEYGNLPAHPVFYSFDLNCKISDYNRRIDQNFKLGQKCVLSIIPSIVWKYFYHPDSGEKEDLPVLS